MSPEQAEPTVMIVEDEDSTRDALEILLASAGYRCSSFAAGETFLAATLPPPPCCLLLDMQLPGQSGLDVQNELNARQPTVPIVFVSGDDSITRAVSAMRAGALDFLQKPYDPELLLDRVARALAASTDGYNRRRQADRDTRLLARVTPREHEILALLVEGAKNKDVARMLGISTRTVERHRMHLMDKLEARTLADLVRVWINADERSDRTNAASTDHKSFES